MVPDSCLCWCTSFLEVLGSAGRCSAKWLNFSLGVLQSSLECSMDGQDWKDLTWSRVVLVELLYWSWIVPNRCLQMFIVPTPISQYCSWVIRSASTCLGHGCRSNFLEITISNTVFKKLQQNSFCVQFLLFLASNDILLQFVFYTLQYFNVKCHLCPPVLPLSNSFIAF